MNDMYNVITFINKEDLVNFLNDKGIRIENIFDIITNTKSGRPTLIYEDDEVD